MIEWLLNYWVHSTLLVGLALITTRLPVVRNSDWQDITWKIALVGGLVTATAHTFSPWGSPLHINFTAPEPVENHQPIISSTPSNLAVPVAVQSKQPLPLVPAARTESALTSGLTIMESAFLIWSLASGFLLVRLYRQVTLEQRTLARRKQLADSETAHWRARLPDLDRVIISTTDAINSPLVTLRGEIVLPMEFEKLSLDQQVAAIAHELGHIKRRDPLWRLMAEISCCLLFIQPLNFIVKQYLSRVAETLADQRSVAFGACAKSLATALATFAEHSRRSAPIAACQMVSRRSHLPERIQNLLELKPMQSFNISRVLTFTVVFLALAVVGLPGVSNGNSAMAKSKTSSNVRVADDGAYSDISLSHTDEHQQMKLKARGRFVFADDDSDIVAMEPGDYFDMTVCDRNKDCKRARLEWDAGKIQRAFWNNGTSANWDQAAQAWFADALTQVFRRTGINAQARAKRIFDQHGAGGLVAEVGMLNSDLVMRVYAKELVALTQLEQSELVSLLNILESEMGSDLEMRLTLAAIMESQELTVDGWSALLDAARTIGSDLELRLVLETVSKQMPDKSELEQAFLSLIQEIGSDLEARLALESLANDFKSIDSQALYLAAMNGIGSDLEARLAYEHFLQSSPTQSMVVQMVADASNSIGSDLELSMMLGQVLDDYGNDEDIRQAVLDATESIGSSIDRERILRRLARQ